MTAARTVLCLAAAIALAGPVGWPPLGRAGAPASSGLTPRLRTATAQLGAGSRLPVWVYLQDRPAGGGAKAADPATLVSPRSLQRRSKVRRAGQLVDTADLALDSRAVRQVAAAAGRVRQRTRWLNAVSVDASREEIAALARLACVQRLDLVGRFRRNGSESLGEAPPVAPPPAGGSAGAKRPSPGVYSLDYGASLGQVQQIGIPALHDQGLSGQGVLVGHFDDGYLRFGHQSLASLQVVAQYDFVDHDPNPVGGASEFFGVHGVQTVSVLGGYAPGNLIGPAYGASFVLARTENDASETPLEEDNWVAAMEWADSIGVDVVSSSVGYLDFEPGYPSYTWADMDGDTAVITRAADLAVARGIVVVNSAGNGGLGVAGQNTLMAPADGDSVITVGGTWADGRRYDSSSVGPTTDNPPRIKPDVMAQGALVTVADPSGPAVYGVGTGTSFACPLVAGVVALLLQAQPAATPMQIATALRSTASRAATPGNLNGWGVVNAPAALAQLNVAVRPASWSELKKAYR